MALNAIRSYVNPTVQTPAGFPGVVEDRFAIIRSYRNANRVAAVKQVVVDTQANSREYTIVLCGLEVAITSDASGTKAEIANALADAINAFPENGRVEAESDGVDTVTITALQAGEDFDLYTLDAYLTASEVTAASNVEAIDFGRIVCQTSDGLGIQLPAANTPVAQVSHATPTNVNSVRYEVGVRMDDGVSFSVSYPSDSSASVQEIVEGLVSQFNTEAPPSTVIATEDNTKVILTAEVAGVGFEVTVTSEGGANWTVTTPTANVAPDFSQRIAGVVRHVFGRPTGKIEADEVCDVIERGAKVYLVPENEPASVSSVVYLRHTDNADDPNLVKGRVRFDDDSSGECIALSARSCRLLSTVADNSARYAFAIDNLEVA